MRPLSIPSRLHHLLNPKPGPVHPAPPLSIQANSEYLILKWTSRVGVSIIISQKYYSLLYYSTTALRLAIYSGANTKIALTGPPSEILTSNFLGYVDMTLT